MMAELLPCPFCGGEAERRTLIHAHGHNMYYVQCSNNKCVVSPGTAAYKSKGADIRAWNTRTPKTKEE